MTNLVQRHVVVVLKTNSGGLWLMPQIRAIRRRGHRVTVVIPPGSGRLAAALAEEGFTVSESPFSFHFTPSARTVGGLFELRRLLRRLKPDIVFYHLYASALAARLSTIGMRVRRVHMVAGPLYLEDPAIAAVERIASRLDSLLIAGSAYTARRYLNLGVLDRPELRTIPYGTDTGRHRTVTARERAAARAQLGIGDDEFVAVIVAHFYMPRPRLFSGLGVKGHEILFEAWSKFVQHESKVQLLVVGAGFDERSEEYRQSLIEEHRALPAVHWVGHTPDVRRYYAASDVSVSPSLSENHGAAVEASAFGIPSIVSDAGALPEVVDERSGWVVPAGDADALEAAIAAAMTEYRSNRMARRRENARSVVEKRFDANKAAEAVADAVLASDAKTDVVVITEARYELDVNGRWTAVDAVNGDQQWSRYTALAGRLTVAGRIHAVQGEGDALTVAPLHPLPAYSGLAGLARAAPPLLGALWRALGQSRLVVLRVPGPLSFIAGAMAIGRRKPYAVEVVGDPLDVIVSLVPGRRGRLAGRSAAVAMRALVGRADAARYVTQRSLQERYPARPGVPVASISNVVLRASDFIDGPRGDARLDAPVRLLAIGSQANRYKGHDVAIRAMSVLRHAVPDARLTLVGDGPEQAVLRDLAHSLGLERVVTFAGHVGRRELIHRHIDEATVLLHPSRTEGLPRTVLEAQARGVPVVGTRVGGIPELVEDACLVDVGDHRALAAAVIRLVMEPGFYPSASRRGWENAQTFRAEISDPKFDAWSHTLESLAEAEHSQHAKRPDHTSTETSPRLDASAH